MAGGVILVQALSAGFHAGNYAKITINNKPIDLQRNSSGHYRGLHVVCINPRTGEHEFAMVFDTYNYPMNFDSFIARGIPEGYIIVIACKDDCITKLSHGAKRWLTALGSKEIAKLAYR